MKIGIFACSKDPYDPENDPDTFRSWHKKGCEMCKGEIDIAGPRCLTDGCMKSRSKVGHKNASGQTYRLCKTCLRDRVAVKCHEPGCLSEPRGVKKPFTCQNHSKLICAAVGCQKKAKLGLHGFDAPVCRVDSSSTATSPVMVYGLASFCWPAASLHPLPFAPVARAFNAPINPISRPTALPWTLSAGAPAAVLPNAESVYKEALSSTELETMHFDEVPVNFAGKRVKYDIGDLSNFVKFTA
ncbi:hypothetical protein CYMTET_3015 [Cymbomonas tetramitiformis]|uniref:Uncharacterized protein n=1 Tax=Cymbomonas tetramitiformis TaxID=36881 RepID=A0AAE0LLG3_9CHLO|nr:hypothetical protein CYMTET_3015 [Cymbomonas tetramitiformis]